MIRAASVHWDDAVDSTVLVTPHVKRKVRVRRLTDAVIFAIILAASALCVEFYLRSRAELALAASRHEVASQRVDAMSIKIEKLERDVKALKTDRNVIEMFARQKFGFVRAGDLVVRVKAPDIESNGPADGRD